MARFSSLVAVAVLASSVLAAPQAVTSEATSALAASSAASASSIDSAATGTVASSDSDTGTATSSAPSEAETVPSVSTEPNEVLWGPDSDPSVPAPIRGGLGASILGPDNIPIDLQYADLLAPPTTDHGSVSNAKWPFSLSHNRLQTGGWAREQNINVMPIATAMASVNMRLEKFAIRELHWHLTAEWAYVLKGSVQVTAVDADGRNFVGTVGPGDLWYFPPGIPHSLQATDDDEDGAEFILVFDDGNFSEDSTFLLTDWLAHVPAEVIDRNFQVDPDAFSHIPAEQLYIFPGLPTQPDSDAPQSPQGTVPNPFAFALSQVNATQAPGGTYKIVDSSTFTVSKTIAVAEVTVEPGAIRELHWHPTQDEWSFFLEGEGRVTIFASQSNARTFNYQAGDIGYVPTAMGHYVENIGNTTLRFLEIFKSDRFEDISLNNWLALTPPDVVKAHLDLSDDTISRLSKTKLVVNGPGDA